MDGVPTNVVDRELQGWWRGEDGLYRTGGSDDPVPIERVMSRWAPLRSIGPAPQLDLMAAEDSLQIAGKHAVASVAAATATIVAELTTTFRIRQLDDPARRARYAIVAGEPVPERAALLLDAVAIGESVAEVSSAVCPYTRDVIADIALDWIRGSGPFVEISHALALVVGTVADAHGSDGWRRLADDWLQPTGPQDRDALACYHLLYSESRYYDPDLGAGS